jgi:hypothetical protein
VEMIKCRIQKEKPNFGMALKIEILGPVCIGSLILIIPDIYIYRLNKKFKFPTLSPRCNLASPLNILNLLQNANQPASWMWNVRMPHADCQCL